MNISYFLLYFITTVIITTVSTKTITTNDKTNVISKNSKLDSITSDKNRLMNEITGHQIDMKLFNKPDDYGLALRQVYEVLSNQLTLLQTRVATVENVADNILTKLTALDCSDIKNEPSGVYVFNMNHGGKRPVSVRCDQDIDGGGWTVIQQRLSKSEKEANESISFDKGWYDYKVGFGDPTQDYWVGLENIYIWTNTRHYELRIELMDFKNDTAHAHYKRFFIDSEQDYYKLHVSDFSGTAGDSLSGAGILDNFTADGMMFSTKDRDNDASVEINCSQYWKIGGWWFNRCSWANLNGPYLLPGQGDGTGINWHRWRNNQYLKSSAIMIRPTKV